MNSKRVCFAVLAAALFAVPGRAEAQAADSAIVYEREVFEYSRGGRADPFRSLLDDAELGVRLEDLTLQGVMVGAEPGQSVAVLSRAGSATPLRVQVGDRIGGIRILSIGQHSVEVLVEEFGVARRGTLELKSVTQKGIS
ncbi:MAG TPA: hypothetical protein VF167_07895 [Longimicrobiaceae bacterium]